MPPAGAASAQLLFTDGDALTGQSDHIANVQLGLEDTEKTQQFTFLFNYASKRVTSRGFQRPDVIENPGLTVDFVARSEVGLFGRPFELKLEVRKIFVRDTYDFTTNGNNRIEVNNSDAG